MSLRIRYSTRPDRLFYQTIPARPPTRVVKKICYPLARATWPRGARGSEPVDRTPLAKTSLFCSLSNQAKPGRFHSDCQELTGSPLAYNHQLAEECWSFSEQIINEKTKDF